MEEKTILTLVTQSPIETLREIKVTFTPAQLSLRNSTVLCYVCQALSVCSWLHLSCLSKSSSKIAPSKTEVICHLFHMNLIDDIKVANFTSRHKKKKKYFKLLIYVHYTINYKVLNVI